MDLNSFDINGDFGSDEHVPVPAGVYKLLIEESNGVPGYEGGPEQVECKFQVLEGEYKSRTFKQWYDINALEEWARNKGRRMLRGLCFLSGITSPTDASVFQGKIITAEVLVNKRKTSGKLVNDIKYPSKLDQRPQSATASAGGGMPWAK